MGFLRNTWQLFAVNARYEYIGFPVQPAQLHGLRAAEARGVTVAVASITYDSLVRVKEIDPTMPTMFDMTLAYGHITDLEHVDYFSVDDFFVTQRLVDEVRGAGKVIYAWTVNDSANMSHLIGYGIDGLVTDNVAEAQELYEIERLDAA